MNQQRPAPMSWHHWLWPMIERDGPLGFVAEQGFALYLPPGGGGTTLLQWAIQRCVMQIAGVKLLWSSTATKRLNDGLGDAAIRKCHNTRIASKLGEAETLMI